MLRTLIIDDEYHIRDTLTKLTSLFCPEVHIVGEASCVIDGIKKILELHPDLVFLDINMKDGTGYKLLHSVHPVRFKVIFISAFDKKTIHAFKLSSMAYLQKPFHPAEIIEAIKQTALIEAKDFDKYLEALEVNARDCVY
ncbi:MAG: response regulator [Bacteroidetes bacterium]|nr:response regulator [Bacteroidota bacterium]MBL6943219.1 response regulator [Bacteroidales bacterium]